MKTTHEALDIVVRGRRTRRFHTVHMLDYQRIDAHSYGVAQLVRFVIGPETPHDRMARLLQAALDHDLGEYITGDVPAPTKRAMTPEMRAHLDDMEWGAIKDHWHAHPALLPADVRALKIADNADGVLHCLDELALGNINANQPLNNFMRYLHMELNFPNGPEVGEPVLYKYLQHRMDTITYLRRA